MEKGWPTRRCYLSLLARACNVQVFYNVDETHPNPTLLMFMGILL